MSWTDRSGLDNHIIEIAVARAIVQREGNELSSHNLNYALGRIAEIVDSTAEKLDEGLPAELSDELPAEYIAIQLGKKVRVAGVKDEILRNQIARTVAESRLEEFLMGGANIINFRNKSFIESRIESWKKQGSISEPVAEALATSVRGIDDRNADQAVALINRFIAKEQEAARKTLKAAGDKATPEMKAAVEKADKMSKEVEFITGDVYIYNAQRIAEMKRLGLVTDEQLKHNHFTTRDVMEDMEVMRELTQPESRVSRAVGVDYPSPQACRKGAGIHLQQAQPLHRLRTSHRQASAGPQQGRKRPYGGSIHRKQI